MKLKFLSYVLLVFFATFGSIEARRHSRIEGNSTSLESHRGRHNNTLPFRPWGTVPPPRHSGNHTRYHPRFNATEHRWGHAGNHTRYHPRFNTTLHRPICTDYWSPTSPCRPFGTVPPPIYPGPWYPTHPHERHGHHHGHSHGGHHGHDHPSYHSRHGHGKNNATAWTLPETTPTHRPNSNSTSLYPSLTGIGEEETNGSTTVTYGSVLNISERPINNEYRGIPDFQNGQFNSTEMSQRLEMKKTEYSDVNQTTTHKPVQNVTEKIYGIGENNVTASSYQ